MSARWLLLLLLPFSGGAQSYDSVAWTSSVLLKAKWPKPVSQQAPFLFSVEFTLTEKQQKIGRTVHTHFYVEPKWIRSASCMADSLEQICRPLAQLYFDCYELESRRVQETVNVGREPDPAMVTIVKQRADSYVEHIRMATNEGRNAAEMQRMRKLVDSALNATPRIYIPEWTEEKFGIGFDIGAGISSFNGNVANYFGPVAGMALGGGMHFQRVYLDLRMMSGRTHSRQDFYLEDFKFSDTNNLQLRQATLGFGFRLFMHPKWAVVPYLGLTTFRVINRDEPDGSLYRKGPASVNLEGGILAEWKFLPAFQNNNSLFSWKLLFRAAYAQTNYLYSLDGGSLKFQVGIGFNVNEIRNSPSGED